MKFEDDVNMDESSKIYKIRYKIMELIEFGVREFELDLLDTSYSMILMVDFCLVFFAQDYLLDFPDCKMEYEPFNYFGFYDLPLIESSWPQTLNASDQKEKNSKFDINNTPFKLLD